MGPRAQGLTYPSNTKKEEWGGKRGKGLGFREQEVGNAGHSVQSTVKKEDRRLTTGSWNLVCEPLIDKHKLHPHTPTVFCEWAFPVILLSNSFYLKSIPCQIR